MEKLTEISLGRKGKMLKFGSLFIVIIIVFILFFGVYKIKIPEYANVEIVASENYIYLISNINLNQTEKIELEGDRSITVNLNKVGTGKYQLDRNKLSLSLIQNLEDNILTDAKILIGQQSFFQSILPFL